MTLNTRTTHTQASPIDCDGVQLTNAQCHIVDISIAWYRKSLIIKLKDTFETKQESMNHSIISSNTPSLATPNIGMYISFRKSLSQLPK